MKFIKKLFDYTPAIALTALLLSVGVFTLLLSDYYYEKNPQEVMGSVLVNTMTGSTSMAVLNAKFDALDVLDATIPGDTGDLSEGANLYYTVDRVNGRIYAVVGATTSLPNLDITESQISDFGDYLDESDYFSTTSQPNLIITESQISDLDHYDDTDTADYINASSTIPDNLCTDDYLLISDGSGWGCIATSSLGISGTGGASYWTQTGDDIYYTTGKVGIGTTTLNEELSIQGDIRLDDVISPYIYLNDTDSNNRAYLGVNNLYMGLGVLTGSDAMDIRIKQSGDRNIMTFASDGNTGIATVTPAYTLDVYGDLRVTDSLTVTGQTTLAHASSTMLTVSGGIYGDLIGDVTGTASGNLVTADINTYSELNTIVADQTLAYGGGAFHDGFSDFVANEHLDWTTDRGATNIHSGNYTDTNTTYTAGGTLLGLTGTTFSLNEGTLTNGKLCTYVTGTGIVCNSDAGGAQTPWTANVNADSFNLTDVSTFTASSVNSVLNADMFSGADIGAKINNAYTALPATGGHILISESGTFATPIVFDTANKPVIMECLTGAVLTYSGTGTSTTFNLNMNHTAFGWGMKNCKMVGSGGENAQTAVVVGGDNGGEGFLMTGCTIKDFGLALSLEDNTWVVNVSNSGFGHANGQNLTTKYCTVNCGENFSFSQNDWFDTIDSSGYNATSCVEIYRDIATIGFNNDSFDDCQVFIGAGVLNANFNGCHFEKPGTWEVPYYDYIRIDDAIDYTHVNISGGMFMNGATSTKPSRYIYNGASLTMTGVTAYLNAGGEQMDSFVDNWADGQVSIHGGISLEGGLAHWVDGRSPDAGVGTKKIDFLSTHGGSYNFAITQGSDNIVDFYNGDITIGSWDEDGNLDVLGNGHDLFADFVANEHIDWTTDQGATNINSGNYANTTYTGGNNLSLVGTVFNVDDAFMLNDGDVGTGSFDFGGAVLEIPNGSAPVANDVGELAHDTTDNQLILDDFVIRTHERLGSFCVSSSSLEFVSGGEIPAPREIDGYTVTDISCYVESGTSVVMTLTDGTNDMDSLSCDVDGAVDDGAIANSAVTAGELMQIDIGTVTGAVDYACFSWFGTIARE